MCTAILYAANTVSQTVQVDGVINFGGIVRRYGSALTMSGGNVVARDSGYYAIDTNFTFASQSAGTAVITLYQNGVAIPGAQTKLSIASATNYSVTIPAEIRSRCCCDTTITAVVSGVALTITNAAIRVAKD